MRHYVPTLGRNPASHPFLFAAGIENSYPTVRGPDGRDLRRDQLHETGFYERWKEDFQLVRELGLEFLRYGRLITECTAGRGSTTGTSPTGQ